MAPRKFVFAGEARGRVTCVRWEDPTPRPAVCSNSKEFPRDSGASLHPRVVITTTHFPANHWDLCLSKPIESWWILSWRLHFGDHSAVFHPRIFYLTGCHTYKPITCAYFYILEHSFLTCVFYLFFSHFLNCCGWDCVFCVGLCCGFFLLFLWQMDYQNKTNTEKLDH